MYIFLVVGKVGSQLSSSTWPKEKVPRLQLCWKIFSMSGTFDVQPSFLETLSLKDDDTCSAISKNLQKSSQVPPSSSRRNLNNDRSFVLDVEQLSFFECTSVVKPTVLDYRVSFVILYSGNLNRSASPLLCSLHGVRSPVCASSTCDVTQINGDVHTLVLQLWHETVSQKCSERRVYRRLR